jgi:methionyl-tRNA formyltransferase
MDTVLLLGMGPTALSALESLAARFRVAGLVRDVQSSLEGEDEVIRRARALEVPVLSDFSIEGIERAVIHSSPDCAVVSSYDRILPSRILGRCRFVNVHYAPLPQYRGRANVNWAIINGEPETAITVHVMAPGLDAGNILYQQTVPIGPDDTVGDLYSKLNEMQREILGETVARYISGYEGEPQDETAATYGCTRVPGDGEIDWASSTGQIYGLIRALAPPYPGAHTYLAARRITILRAAPLANAPRYVGRIPGRIVGRSRRDGHVDVLTGDGVLEIYEVAADDFPAGPASALIGSTRQTLGLRTADLLARIELLESRLNLLDGAGCDAASRDSR